MKESPRFLLGDALICLPLVILLLGGYFLFSRALPAFEKREAERIEAHYREIARRIKDGETKDARTMTLANRRSRGRLSRGQWGLYRSKDALLVWYHPQSSPNVLALPVKEELPFDYARFFRWTGSSVLVMVLLLTNIGLRSFRRMARERDDFLAAAAHDLTTPLVGMRMMIGKNDDEARRLNERMLLLVDNINGFLRLGGRRRRPEPKPCDLVALCREAYALFADDYADSEGGEVSFRPQSGADTGDAALFAMADETMLLQILWNLFGNDLKYAAPFGRVEVRLAAEGERVRVEFADEGPGMSARQRRKAFDRYYRARTVLETGKGGFGIGLCTAREFARAMGGDLAVRANSPRGCVFTLTLPAARRFMI